MIVLFSYFSCNCQCSWRYIFFKVKVWWKFYFQSTAIVFIVTWRFVPSFCFRGEREWGWTCLLLFPLLLFLDPRFCRKLLWFQVSPPALLYLRPLHHFLKIGWLLFLIFCMNLGFNKYRKEMIDSEFTISVIFLV